jgi:hypothetical protein
VEIKLPFVNVLSPKTFQIAEVDVAHMFLGIIYPSFFLVSTWKVNNQKYLKDTLILGTCSCFYLEGEIKQTYANPDYLLVVLCL